MSGYIPPKDLKLGLEMTYQALRSGYDHGARSLWVRARELNFVDPPSRKLEYCWAYSLAKYEDSEADSFFEGYIRNEAPPQDRLVLEDELNQLRRWHPNIEDCIKLTQKLFGE